MLQTGKMLRLTAENGFKYSIQEALKRAFMKPNCCATVQDI